MTVSNGDTFTTQIEAARTRLVSLAGIMITGGFLVTLALEATSDNPNAIYLGTIAIGVLIGLGGLALGLSGMRRAATLLLTVGLAGLATVLVLNHGLAYEIALSAFVGVLLIAIAGTNQSDVLVATVVVVALGMLTYLLHPDSIATLAGALSVSGLLIATGVTLSWMQDNLLRAIGQLERSSIRLRREANEDDLTGLSNRRGFKVSFAESVRRASAARPVSLFVIDVDKLKGINDKLGHPAGDKALVAVADAIRANTREDDVAGRIGGDEFGVLLTTGGLASARQVASRIHSHLETFSRNGADLTVSIGVAETRDPFTTLEELIKDADEDMYAHRTGELPNINDLN